MPLKKNPKYDLKRKYPRFLETGLIITLVIIIAAFKLVPAPNLKIITKDFDPGLIDVVIIPITKNDIPKEEKPERPSIPVESTDISEITDDPVYVDISYYKPAVNPPAYKEKTDDYVEPIFVEVPEVMPSPVGGIESIYSKISYPELAVKAGIQGQVLITAYIDENGNVVKAELVKGIGAGCDEEALKAIKGTKFNPGRQRDRPVKVKIILPVKFILR